MEKKLLNIDLFLDFWLEQETSKMNEDEKEQYTDELSDALNFKDIFTVIALWSQTDYKIRVKSFLERNNFTFDSEVLNLLN
jgi:hypothetical protein